MKPPLPRFFALALLAVPAAAWSSRAIAADGAAAASSLTITADFPGGNVVLEKIEGDTVHVRPDLRDTQGSWFYWYFAVQGAAGRTLTFDFGRKVMTVRGPAVSLDDGRTWQWLERMNEQETSFTYSFPADAGRVRFSVAMPYVESNLNDFLARHRGNAHLKREVLCRTAKGREVERLHLGRLDGNCRFRVLLTCRHHACEMMASHVLEGILAGVLADTPEGKWLCENVEFAVVPFMDKDGVEDGDQGKNRKPHDHNRDYGPESIYPSVKALKELALLWSKNRLTLSLDLHNPLLRGPQNESIFIVGSQVPNIAAQESVFSKLIEVRQTGPLVFSEKNNMVLGSGWNKPGSHPKELTCGGWLGTLPGIKLAATLEIPYATASGTAMTADNARLFGRDLARAIRNYLERDGEKRASHTNRSPATITRMGPLRVHPTNRHYFTDGTKDAGGSLKAVYLTGSHTWLNLQDGATTNRLPPFDYDAYLDFLERHHHNLVRLWAWEGSAWVRTNSERVAISPLPFARSGPGQALDGGPKFDVTRFDPVYFERLRERVVAARERGLYVGVMLFQGFSVSRKDKKRADTPWTGHPLHAANNINRIDGDANGDGEGYEVHTLGNAAITRVQEAYVRKVVDTVNDLDNVIYEISNESHGGSTAWQHHLIDWIQRYERTKPNQHPVWMSFCWDGMAGSGTMADLFASPAEAVSPTGTDKTHRHPRHYCDDPPVTEAKVVIADTDHLWGVGGSRAWVWKSFLRGLHPIFMDTYRHTPFRPSAELDPQWEDVRLAMGQTRRLAERMNLAAMTPHAELTSTAYCLANPGVEYLICQPAAGRPFSVTLKAGRYRYEWFAPGDSAAAASHGRTESTGEARPFKAPFATDAVLYLKAESATSGGTGGLKR